MKTAVIYYSLDGNCALVAQEIKALMNADLIRLQTKDEKKRGKIGKMLWGVGMVLTRKKPPLKPYTFDPIAYDLIIIGAPVWASSPAPPIKTFLSETKIIGKKIALFVCCLGDKGASLDELKNLLNENEIVSMADFKGPTKDKIAEWVKSLS